MLRRAPHGRWHTYGPFDIPNFPSRSIRVYEPHDHVRDGSRAALYMFDGQNVFGDEGSFAGGWFAHDAVDRLTPRSFNRPIVVAIPNGGDRRMDELSAWKMPMGGGQADAFVDWIADTLMPIMVRDFGLTGGAVGAVIAGSSMGGLGALYAHFKRPDAFGGALCMSPSFFVGRGAMYDFIDRQPPLWFSRVYIDCGLKEGGGRMMNAAKTMADKLRGRGYGRDQLMWRPDRRGTHNERHWRRRLPKALRFMFKR